MEDPFRHNERAVILERTRAGMAAARARGRVGGQPQRLTPEKVALARVMREKGDHSMSQIAKALLVQFIARAHPRVPRAQASGRRPHSGSCPLGSRSVALRPPM
jgi:hypothetical protein